VNELLLGLDVTTSAATSADPVEDAIRAEELGFDFVSASDHPSGRHPTYETWTLLSWIAARTSRISLATRVLGVPNRPPAVVAKMAETLDRLSGGRLILGLGGGASDDEFRAFGLRVPPPRDKIDGLAEAIQIARGLWTERAFTFGGRLYRTEAAEMEPKASHHIPIWLGTFGPRALALTGRFADGWIPSLGHAPPESVPAMRAHIERGAREAGRDAETITSVYNLEIRVDERAATEPSVVSGSSDAVVERLNEFVMLGFDGFNFQPVGPDRREQIDRLANEVVPTLRRSIELSPRLRRS
jgi:alkanesulfonate monooxygenase SsuD/methylene tetrahydromethanopterin reductase-like flavin-dependent oxidoreductase (luciferase family)